MYLKVGYIFLKSYLTILLYDQFFKIILEIVI